MSSWPKVKVKKYKEKRRYLVEDDSDYRIQNPRRQKKKRKRSEY